MTLSTSTASQTFPGNGVTQIFPCAFRIFQASDVSVSLVNATTGVSTALILNSDYTLTGEGNQTGFTLSTSTPVASGINLLVARNIAYTQPTDFTNQGAFFPTMHEDCADRLGMQIQQLAGGIQRTLQLPDGIFPVASGALPYPSPLAPLVWNAAGNGLDNGSASMTGDMLLRGNLAATSAGNGASLVGYIASGAGAVARTALAKERERTSVADYGADPTGVLSSVAAFNAALVANDDVFIPAGTYLIDDAVTIGLGKRLYGAGRRKTILHMPSTFNMSATGCLVFTGGEPGPEVTDLTIIQDQPDSTTATVYPPCIYTQNVARFVLRRLRLACVYVGIDMKGNCGGALLDDIELSPLSVGIDIDGSIDSVKISRLHLWVFAGAGFGGLTTNQRVSYTAAYGIKSGRCDDLHLSDSLLLSMIKALYLYNSASGYTFGQVTNVDFDSRGGLWVVTDGRIQLAACTMTMGATDSWFINMTGGAVAVDSTRFVANTFNPAANGLIEMSGGSLTLGPGCTLSGSSNDVQLIYATNSTLKLNGATISRAVNVAYTAPAVRVVNTQGVAVGCLCAPLGTGSSVFIKLDTDTNGFVVKDNFAKGWTVSTPAASALANTIVDGNLGAGTNRDTFSGYFSSDGTTTKVLPTGWSVSRVTAGTYTVTHNLDLAANTNMSYQLTADTTASGCSAQVDMAGTNTNVFKVRTYVGATLTDCGVFFVMRRNRS